MARIDLHHHFVPDAYREGLAAAGVTNVGRVPFPDWSQAGMLSAMERLGVSRAILSLSAPSVDFGDQALAISLARATNDHLMQLKSQHPGRIGGFATLPLPHMDAALAELARLQGSGLEGVILLTNYRGRYFSQGDFAPLLAELNRRKALAFLHPAVPPGAEQLGLALPPPILEFVFDTTRAVADMIFRGVFDQYPDIRWVVSHLGGTLPFVAWRLSMIEHSPRGAYAAFRERGRSVESYLQSLYYDTAVSAGPASLKAALDIVGPSRLVFGSDIPFLPMAFAELTAASLARFSELSARERRAIDRENALALLSQGAL